MTDRPARKAIPDRIKLRVVLRQGGHCDECGEKLDEDTEFDHRPALMAREVRPDGSDYIPAQLDPVFIFAVHGRVAASRSTLRCHGVRTNGPGGEKRITTRGGDKGDAAHARSVQATEAAHAAAMKDKRHGRKKKPTSRFPKGRKLPSRPFPQGAKA